MTPVLWAELGDGHAFAGAHAQQVDFAFGAGSQKSESSMARESGPVRASRPTVSIRSVSARRPPLYYAVAR